MKKLILISFLLSAYIYSAVMQTKLENNLWQLIGFAGNHLADSSVAYNADTTREIIDIADENTTYLVKENNNDNGQLAYIRADYTLSTTYISSTTRLRASIGIFAIKNSISPSGKTTLSTNINSAVKIKVKEPKIFNPNVPHYRMYVKGKTHPIVRIDYQADYEGSSFRIKFGNENEDYQAYFDNSATFGTATILKSAVINKLDLSAYSSPIKDSIDFKAEDNNFSAMALNNFEIKDARGAYSKDLASYETNTSYSVIVYKFEDGRWKIFNSANKASSNDFDKFDIGQGYWIKTNNTAPFVRIDTRQTTLISRDSLNVDMDYSKLKNGWNILNFKDTPIRYSPTSVFIPYDVIYNGTLANSLSIYRLNRTGNNDRHSIDVPISFFHSSIGEDNSSQSARFININAKAQEEMFGYEDKIRAIPALKVETNGSTVNGMIIMSNSKFGLNTILADPVTTIAGQALEVNTNIRSVYGEYINFINTNELNGTDINASLSLSIPKYSSSPLMVGDLNEENKTIIARNILRAMNTLSTKAGEIIPSTSNAVYLTDLNFNSYVDYNNSNNSKSIAIASGARFLVADTTYSKIYKFNRNGKFKLVSSDGGTDIDSGTTANIATLITSINNAKDTTKIIATSLGANSNGDIQFMLTSTKKGIRILENDNVNLFDDVSLTSSSIANTALSKGVVSSVSSVSDVLSADVSFNREAIDGIGDWGGRKDLLNLQDNTPVTVANLLASLAADKNVVHQGNLDTGGPIVIDSDENLTIAGDFIISGDFEVKGNLVVGGDLISTSTVLVNINSPTANVIIRGNFIMDTGSTLVINKSNIYVRGSATTVGTNVFTNPYTYTIENTPLTTAQKQGISYLDKNISGTPVGLFNLNNQAFPNTISDLKSNPTPSLDYPLSGGIIESFYKNKKRINTIMTMEYSSNNQGFWKVTDLTKDIGTLYGNSYDDKEEYNNDYQGIFNLYPNKAYWVNVSSITNGVDRPADIKEALDLKDSKVTLQSYTSFSNTFNKGLSTTQNHINHRLNIKFKDDGKFIASSGDNVDYYNVVAIIKGQRYYLKRNGTYFSLDINDNDMPLKEKTINESDEPIILEAYDGSGLAFKEMINDTHFKIPYFKPSTPSLSWSNDNELILDSINQKDIENKTSSLELYVRAISDIDSVREKALISDNNLSQNKENIDNFLKWNYDTNISLRGGLTSLRAVIKKQNKTKKVSFYSDVRAILYAPLKKGHILEANATNKKAFLPYSYLSNKRLQADNGVQLSYISSDIKKISMAYYPQGRKEGLKSLQATAFGESGTMFLRVNTGATNKDVIASITYIPEYANSIFYISFNGRLFQGRFADSNSFDTDGNAYNLEGSTISVDTFTNGTALQADTTRGMFIEGGQGISK